MLKTLLEYVAIISLFFGIVISLFITEDIFSEEITDEAIISQFLNKTSPDDINENPYYINEEFVIEFADKYYNVYKKTWGEDHLLALSCKLNYNFSDIDKNFGLLIDKDNKETDLFFISYTHDGVAQFPCKNVFTTNKISMICENLPEPTFLDSYTEMELDRDSLDFSIIKSVSKSGSNQYYPPLDKVVDDADKYKQQCSVTDFAELLTKLVKVMEDNRANNKF